MKKISFYLLLVLIVTMLMISSFANGSNLNTNAPTSVQVGEQFTVVTSLSNCADGSSLGVSLSYDSSFEFVSGEMLKKDGISKFDQSTQKGTYGSTSGATDLNGDIVKLTFKALSANINSQTISINVQVKNGKTVVFDKISKVSIQIKCSKHSYNNWSKLDEQQHTHICKVCGNVENGSHSWDVGKISSEATCAKTGNKIYTCSICGATKTETLAKTTNHKYGVWEKLDQTTHSHTCSICGKIEKVAHSWDNGKITKNATCKETGEKTYTCSVCGETKKETISKTTNHKYGAWGRNDQTTHSHTCTICGKIEKVAHSWDNGKITKNATCKETGEKTHTCSVCGEKQIEIIPKTNTHTLSPYIVSKEATCMDEGIETAECLVCKTKVTREVPALGHAFSNSTITKEATCTESGEETGTCTRCGETTTSVIKPSGHKFGEWTIENEPTCTNDGTEKRTCVVCRIEEKRDTDALGHNFTELEIVKEPTAFSNGIKQGVCTRCNEKIEEIIPCQYFDSATNVLLEMKEGVFEEGTEIYVKKIKADDVKRDEINQKLNNTFGLITVYEIAAQRGDLEAKANGTINISIPIPSDYGESFAVFDIGNEIKELSYVLSQDEKMISISTDKLSAFAICDSANIPAPTTMPTDVPNETSTNEPTTLPAIEDIDEPKPVKNGSSIGIIVLISIVLILLLTLFIILFVKRKRKKN